MKKKLLLLGLLPVLGVGAASTRGALAAPGRLDSFYSDVGNDRSKYCTKAMELNSKVADEGVVLLKNADDFLPMAKGKKITLAGKSSVSLVRGGAGSGAGSVSQGITEIKMDKSLTDDWSLNGDIFVWYPVLNCGFELSSMGIRVNKESLQKQLTEKNELFKMEYDYHKAIMSDDLPLTIGGGIGQSRVCMYLLNKAHIGEVQASYWPKEDLDEFAKHNIHLFLE